MMAGNIERILKTKQCCLSNHACLKLVQDQRFVLEINLAKCMMWRDEEDKRPEYFQAGA